MEDLKNNFKFLFPELASQWHPIKNGDLKPGNFLPMSHKKAWWQCEKRDDHDWDTSIANRTNNNSGCPYCSGRKKSNN